MPKIKIIVWYTLTGKIVAVGQPTSEFEIAFCGEADQAVLVTEIDDELLDGLHRSTSLILTGKLS